MQMRLSLFLAAGLALACADRDATPRATGAAQLENGRPDELPALRTDGDAFRYPSTLFEDRVQGNVTLRIYIDSLGYVVPDSTVVFESSGYPTLDSAAVDGTRRALFAPARLRGRPVGMSILLPVYYRHPEAPPLPGDTTPNPGDARNP